ncbi:Uncharacterised protein [Mycobacteroides abscessus subsp. massiliense]|uniref:hypothetical protein n=1 Tax=Mycobacteroides abscessus TaxID=36809 RepID=UPI0009A7DBCE|nr:hypothetical protein [Mycobacteroides abscessus]MBE5502380.1 hypothetical protein [Mycobacteroides abscessus]SLH57395.1 Uncharacterised protein [Mycobacteroides abscessus subsp. massiliense]
MNRTEKLTGDQYMELLVDRLKKWQADHPQSDPKYPPLLEWFIREGDEDLVELPEPKQRPKPTPRTYRSAASLRAERDKLAARNEALFFDGPCDRAAANINTRSRWKKLDSDIAKGAALAKRIRNLEYRIADADAREARALSAED